MAFNNLDDDFDSFGSGDGGFGVDSLDWDSGLDGDDTSFDSDDSFGDDQFDDGDSFANNGQPAGDADPFMDFQGDEQEQVQQNNTGGSSNKKTALIAIGVGIVGCIAVFFIASKLINGNKQPAKVNDPGLTVSSSGQNSVADADYGHNVDSMMQSGGYQEPASTTVTQPVQEQSNIGGYKNEYWKEFDGSVGAGGITFNADYSDLVFTITDIKHYVASVDAAGSLCIKTELTGSLAGLAGTFKLDVPFDKGTKLKVGQEFTVHVQMGTYGDKKVVGEIRY